MPRINLGGSGDGSALLGTDNTWTGANDYAETPTVNGTPISSSGGTITAASITDSTTTGRAVLKAADAATARTAIGAGTSSLALGTTGTTAKAGDYAPTKTDVGLGNVDNTSDANKPVSTATQTALNAKANTSALATVATTGAYTDLTGKPTIPAAYTDEQAQDAVAAAFAAGTHTGVTVTYNDAGNALSLAATGAGTLTDGSVTEAKMATALLHTIEALIIWDGTTGSQPLRSTATADTARPVRWRQPSAPPTTTGYAVPGLDVWEKYTP